MSFGRMERARSDQPMSEINVTPLVDVMLVLVVIFILTAPLLASSIRLELPRSQAARPGQAPASLALVVDAGGRVYVNDQVLTPAELDQRLAQAATLDPDTEVQLRADQAVPYGRVVEVIGQAQKAGLARIGFVADSAAAAPVPGR